MAADEPLTPRRVIGTYVTTNLLFTLAASIIWGVNTLFLLDAGLDLFRVMVVNSAFTIGQVVFEVPTGVIADTIGRKASFMIGIGALFLSTLWYVGSAMYGWGIWSFVGASVLIGFGFTCQTGAVDAWLVDALDFTGYTKPKEGVFALGGAVFGMATLLGTVAGGFLGQVDLTLPYLTRSAILLLALLVTGILMKEVGFQPRPLRLRNFREETRAILDAGLRYGWHHRVVRPLMLVSLTTGVYFLFAFYTWQRYALDLLGRELVWVSGALVAGFAGMGIIGNALVRPIMRSGLRRRNAGRVLAALMGAATLVSIGMGAAGLVRMPGYAPFAVAAVLWLGFGLLNGVSMPVRQAYINEQIPSAQRATVLSLDSFFADGGGAAGQPALGWVAREVSIPVAYLVGSAFLGIAVPLYLRAGARSAPVVPAEPGD